MFLPPVRVSNFFENMDEISLHDFEYLRKKYLKRDINVMAYKEKEKELNGSDISSINEIDFAYFRSKYMKRAVRIYGFAANENLQVPSSHLGGTEARDEVTSQQLGIALFLYRYLIL